MQFALPSKVSIPPVASSKPSAASATSSYGAASAFFNTSHAALCTACHGVRSQPVPFALVGECSIPVV